MLLCRNLFNGISMSTNDSITNCLKLSGLVGKNVWLAGGPLGKRLKPRVWTAVLRWASTRNDFSHTTVFSQSLQNRSSAGVTWNSFGYLSLKAFAFWRWVALVFALLRWMIEDNAATAAYRVSLLLALGDALAPWHFFCKQQRRSLFEKATRDWRKENWRNWHSVTVNWHNWPKNNKNWLYWLHYTKNWPIRLYWLYWSKNRPTHESFLKFRGAKLFNASVNNKGFHGNFQINSILLITMFNKLNNLFILENNELC